MSATTTPTPSSPTNPSTTPTTSTTSTTPSTTPTPTSTTPTSTTPASSPPVQTTATSSTPSNPVVTSNGSTETSTANTSTSSVAVTLSVASTSVGESTSVTTSDGQLITTTVGFTTTIAPGTVVTTTPNAPATRTSSGTNTGAIVGGVIGGVAGLIIFALLVFYCLRKRRKDEFDGNFDPAHVNTVKGGGGGTLPDIDLGEEGVVRRGGEVEEDDGMGGRLGAGAGGGGIIMPYSFKPSTPIGGGGVGSQQYQNPQMQQMGNVGVVAGTSAGYGNEKRGMRHQYSPVPNPASNLHGHNPSVSSGSHYPTTLASSSNHAPNQHLNAHSMSPEPHTPGGFSASDGSSSIGGNAFNYHPQAVGRGPSPGPSVMSSSTSGGRHAKEMEAMGRVIANPDEVIGGPQAQQQQYGQFPAYQAYLQNGPGPHQQHQYQPPSSSSMPAPLHPSQASQSAGSAVVVHEDGGRVVLRKGGDVDEGEALSPEIPPTYDSLPVDVRRDS